jgi:sulfur relay (sulfurtransferase) DsrC/TusE family protein
LCQSNQNDHLIDIIRLFIQQKINVNWKNNKKWNVLQFICKYYSNDNLINIVKLLIKNKIDVNHTANEGNALHLLCKYYPNENIIDIFQLLINNGIIVKFKGGDPRILIRQNRNQEKNSNALEFLNRNYTIKRK